MNIQAQGLGRIVVEVGSEAETDRLGQALASLASPGLVIGLDGPLGAGKTRLVRAFAEALGVDPDAISSPTFVLIQEYAGRWPIFHGDAYRLDGPDAFLALGADELFDGPGVCLIEWADRVEDVLPPGSWRIRIAADGENREFTISLPQGAEAHVLGALSNTPVTSGPSLNSP